MNKGLSNLLLRWVFLAVGVTLAAKIVPGIHCEDGMTLLVVVVLLSLFNAFLKPLLLLFTLPLVILSAGFGLWLINAFLLWGAALMIGSGFRVDGLFAALMGSAIISLTNIALSTLVGPNKVKVRRGPPPPNQPQPQPPPGKGDVIDV